MAAVPTRKLLTRAESQSQAPTTIPSPGNWWKRSPPIRPNLHNPKHPKDGTSGSATMAASLQTQKSSRVGAAMWQMICSPCEEKCWDIFSPHALHDALSFFSHSKTCPTLKNKNTPWGLNGSFLCVPLCAWKFPSNQFGLISTSQTLAPQGLLGVRLRPCKGVRMSVMARNAGAPGDKNHNFSVSKRAMAGFANNHRAANTFYWMKKTLDFEYVLHHLWKWRALNTCCTSSINVGYKVLFIYIYIYIMYI